MLIANLEREREGMRTRTRSKEASFLSFRDHGGSGMKIGGCMRCLMECSASWIPSSELCGRRQNLSSFNSSSISARNFLSSTIIFLHSSKNQRRCARDIGKDSPPQTMPVEETRAPVPKQLSPFDLFTTRFLLFQFSLQNLSLRMIMRIMIGM